MKTTTITIKEYSEKSDYGIRYITKVISDGNMLTGMVSTRKSGGTWLIEVLNSWYENNN